MNPNHVPAGVPEGGQFDDAGGSGGGGGSDQKSGATAANDVKDDNHARELYDKSRNGMFDSKETHAIRGYAEGDYEKINSSLRNGGTGGAATKELDRAFGKVALGEDTHGYRVVSDDVFRKMASGNSFTDKGFVSTTWDPKVASDLKSDSQLGYGGKGHVVKIVMPKGSKALPIQKFSLNSKEREVLIRRNATFDVKKTKDGLELHLRHHK